LRVPAGRLIISIPRVAFTIRRQMAGIRKRFPQGGGLIAPFHHLFSWQVGMGLVI
jgi:hypothetical protein